MCRYRGLAPALEPVLLLQPGHAVILRAVEEDRTVVLAYFIALWRQVRILFSCWDKMCSSHLTFLMFLMAWTTT